MASPKKELIKTVGKPVIETAIGFGKGAVKKAKGIYESATGKATKKAEDAATAARLTEEMAPKPVISQTGIRTTPTPVVTPIFSEAPKVSATAIKAVKPVTAPIFSASDDIAKATFNPKEMPLILQTFKKGELTPQIKKAIPYMSEEGVQLVDKYGEANVVPFVDQILENTIARQAAERAAAKAAKAAKAAEKAAPEAVPTVQTTAVGGEVPPVPPVPPVTPVPPVVPGVPSAGPALPGFGKANVISAAALANQALANRIQQDAQQSGQELNPLLKGYVGISNVAGTLGGFKLGQSVAKKAFSDTYKEAFKSASLTRKLRELSTDILQLGGLATALYSTYGFVTSPTGETEVNIPDPESIFVMPDPTTPAAVEGSNKLNTINQAFLDAQNEIAALTNDPAILKQQIDQINSIYDNAIKNVQATYQPMIDAEQGYYDTASQATKEAAARMAEAAGMEASSVSNQVPITGMSPEQASAAGVSGTAMGGAGSTYAALARELAAANQAQAAANQLSLAATREPYITQAGQNITDQIASLEASRAANLIASQNAAIENARQLAIKQAGERADFKLQQLQGKIPTGGVDLSLPMIDSSILNNPNLAGKGTLQSLTGFSGSPQDASAVMSQIKGAAQLGGDYTNPSTAMSAWAELYAKLEAAYPTMTQLLISAGWPADAQSMYNRIFAKK